MTDKIKVLDPISFKIVRKKISDYIKPGHTALIQIDENGICKCLIDITSTNGTVDQVLEIINRRYIEYGK